MNKRNLKELGSLLIDILVYVLICSVLVKLNYISFKDDTQTRLTSDAKTVLFFIIPIAWGIIKSFIVNLKVTKRFWGYVKNFLSPTSIFWQVEMEYQVSSTTDNIETIFKSIQDKIKEISIKSYDNNVKTDIRDRFKFLYYIKGIRVEGKLLINNSLLTPELPSNILHIKIAGESPVKTFIRFHKNKLIFPIRNFIGETINVEESKFSVKANTIEMPIAILDEYNQDFQVLNYSLELEADKDTFVDITKRKGFTCTSNTLEKCMENFNECILIK